MGLFGWLVLGWIAFNVFRAIAKGNAGTGTSGAGKAPPRPRAPRPRPSLPPAPGAPDQREAWQLVLEQLQAVREKTPAAAPKRPVVTRSKWEEGVSRETAPPPPVDYDDEAEQVVRRRIAAAQARDHATGPADHSAFDARIRAPQPEAEARAAVTPAELRRAFIWRELLGPPVAMRD